MKKLFNFRLFVVAFFALVLGVFFALACWFSFWFAVGFGAALVVFVVLAFKLNWFEFLKDHLFATIAILLCFVAGVVSYSAWTAAYRSDVVTEGYYQIEARAKSVSLLDKNDCRKIVVDEIVVTDNYSNTSKKLKFDYTIYDASQVEVLVGQKIGFVSYISQKGSYFSTRKIKFGSAINLTVVNDCKKLSTSEKVKYSCYDAISRHVSSENAGLLFAMTFGDDSLLQYEVRDLYAGAGIAHVLAVSGLHVGFVFMLLSFLLDRLRAQKYIKFFAVSIVLVLYAWICGFSVSVVRASVMCIVLMFAGLRRRQYDGLSALCLAAIVIVGANALQLFTVSFLLSFSCVLAIMCVAKLITTHTSKAYPKAMSGAVAACVSAGIGSQPFTSLYFGYFATYSLLANLLCLPIVSLAFMVSFVAAPITVLWDAFGFLLKIPDFLMLVVTSICKFLSILPVSVLAVSINKFVIVLWFVSLILASDFFLAKKKLKWSLFGASAGATFVLLVLNLCNVF